MGEDERPAGPFNDMLGVVETRVGARGATKAVHEDDASTTRAAGRAEERTILEREDKESVVGKCGQSLSRAVLQNYCGTCVRPNTNDQPKWGARDALLKTRYQPKFPTGG